MAWCLVMHMDDFTVIFSRYEGKLNMPTIVHYRPAIKNYVDRQTTPIRWVSFMMKV